MLCGQIKSALHLVCVCRTFFLCKILPRILRGVSSRRQWKVSERKIQRKKITWLPWGFFLRHSPGLIFPQFQHIFFRSFPFLVHVHQWGVAFLCDDYPLIKRLPRRGVCRVSFCVEILFLQDSPVASGVRWNSGGRGSLWGGEKTFYLWCPDLIGCSPVHLRVKINFDILVDSFLKVSQRFKFLVLVYLFFCVFVFVYHFIWNLFTNLFQLSLVYLKSMSLLRIQFSNWFFLLFPSNHKH